MASSLALLKQQYGSDSDDDDDGDNGNVVSDRDPSKPARSVHAKSTQSTATNDIAKSQMPDEITTNDPELTLHLQPLNKRSKSTASGMQIVSAPFVPKESGVSDIVVDPFAKSIMYNLGVDQMYAPVAGPVRTAPAGQMTQLMKNCVTGHFEAAHVGSFMFETQRRTYDVRGFAADPSSTKSSTSFIGENAAEHAVTLGNIAETKSTLQTRKKVRNDDSSDVAGYKGPWADVEGEEHVSKPTEDDMRAMEEYRQKRIKRRGPRRGGAASAAGAAGSSKSEETKDSSTLHIKDAVDYAGRTFMQPPRDVDTNLLSDAPPTQCFLPKKLAHCWSGHQKGVTTIRWLPQTAHLFLSCGMDCKVKLWRMYGDRAMVRSYMGHAQTVKDICFNNDGTKFLSTAYDRYCKLWDTETGQCIQKFQTPQQKMMNCVVFNPDADKQNLFVAGTADKKILCFDLTSGEVSQEYDRHMGAINTVTFIEQNRRFVSTSDDKTIRIWEWDIPVDFKYIAEPTMHSMPAVAQSPDTKWLLMQSMDNKLNIFQCHANRYRIMNKKKFGDHMVAGYGCKPAFSPEMSYAMSGDADGKVYIWDWKTTRQLSRWKAHDKCCIQVLWHPHETSRVISASWDGSIKLWE